MCVIENYIGQVYCKGVIFIIMEPLILNNYCFVLLQQHPIRNPDVHVLSVFPKSQNVRKNLKMIPLRSSHLLLSMIVLHNIHTLNPRCRWLVLKCFIFLLWVFHEQVSVVTVETYSNKWLDFKKSWVRV